MHKTVYYRFVSSATYAEQFALINIRSAKLDVFVANETSCSHVSKAFQFGE